MNYLERDAFGIYKKHLGPGPFLMGAQTLIGDAVFNDEGDDLGDILEIMLDMRTGKVAYAVLSFGGFLGLGDKLFAVPWHALKLDTVRKAFVLNVTKSQLSNAPGFEKEAWPDMTDIAWVEKTHMFYKAAMPHESERQSTEPHVSGVPPETKKAR